MRRRFPWSLVALLFILVPVLEIYVLIRIGSVIGPWWTILLLVADGLFGAWLIRHEGARAWRALTVAVESGRMPHRELADAALILVGGAFLLAPGFVTDVAGLFCVLPFTRPFARRLLARFAAGRLAAGVAAAGPARPAGQDSVVRGEVID
jgi:UPF0716 protein FxsA